MITRSKAPLRLGLAGGGTDVSPFCDIYGGYILNATITMYAHCTIEDIDGPETFFVATDFGTSDCIKTDSISADEGLRLHRGVHRRIAQRYLDNKVHSIRVTTYCDAPPGSGLGSSSTLVVAIIQAYVDHFNLPLGEYDIAHLAFEIERIDLQLDGGRQDQYAATFGGFNFMEFYKDDRVIVNPLRIRQEVAAELEASLVLFYTGVSRDSDAIIRDQIKSVSALSTNLEAMMSLKEHALAMKEMLLRGNIKAFADIFHASWLHKKQTSTKVSNPTIDSLYEKALNAGAIAGKVSGAGGGGFMMFIVEPIHKLNVIRALNTEKGHIMHCQFSKEGAHAWRADAMRT
jgi:D-glycero-alpha-D-manno-heptose-7-phosphate kinase